MRHPFTSTRSAKLFSPLSCCPHAAMVHERGSSLRRHLRRTRQFAGNRKNPYMTGTCGRQGYVEGVEFLFEKLIATLPLTRRCGLFAATRLAGEGMRPESRFDHRSKRKNVHRHRNRAIDSGEGLTPAQGVAESSQTACQLVGQPKDDSRPTREPLAGWTQGRCWRPWATLPSGIVAPSAGAPS